MINKRLSTKSHGYVHVADRYPGMTLEEAYHQADLDKKKRFRQKHSARLVEHSRQYYKVPKNRAKVAAKLAVRRAVKHGRMSKKPCDVCGEPKVEAHHEDYTKRFEVVWLCKKHHVIADDARRARESR